MGAVSELESLLIRLTVQQQQQNRFYFFSTFSTTLTALRLSQTTSTHLSIFFLTISQKSKRRNLNPLIRIGFPRTSTTSFQSLFASYFKRTISSAFLGPILFRLVHAHITLAQNPKLLSFATSTRKSHHSFVYFRNQSCSVSIPHHKIFIRQIESLHHLSSIFLSGLPYYSNHCSSQNGKKEPLFACTLYNKRI